MKDSQKNAALTLWVTYLALAIVIAVSIGLAWMLNVNSIHRMLLPVERTAIIAGYYCSLPMILLALWEVVGLLKNIQRRAVFVAENVKCLAVIRTCCLGIFAVCLVAGCFFFPLLLVVAIMGFLGLMMQVLKQVMAQAVAIREENDLTV
mgnify:CR=1 FL=1